MFKPSRDLAARAVQSCQGPSHYLTALPRLGALADAARTLLTGKAGTPVFTEQRPDAHSKNLPAPGSPIDPVQVQVAMGEKLQRLLGTAARWHGVVQPGTRVVVLTADGKFAPEIATHLASCLNLTLADDASRAVLDQLGNELRDWVRGSADEARRLGLEAAPDGSVTLLCPKVEPILEPLKKNS